MREMYKLNGAALLRGFRGNPAPDVRAAAEIVSKLGMLMLSAESIMEVDINPLIVHAEGNGASAVDALILTGDCRHEVGARLSPRNAHPCARTEIDERHAH